MRVVSHFCLKSANSHRDGPPEPEIFVSVVTFEAMQLRGVCKVEHSPGWAMVLVCAGPSQLLILNLKGGGSDDAAPPL